jgi:hypothetical protein
VHHVHVDSWTSCERAASAALAAAGVAPHASGWTLAMENNGQVTGMSFILIKLYLNYQPINVPTAGAQAFLMDYI